LFDDNHLHEHPCVYHTVQSIHFSYHGTLNYKLEQHDFPYLIDPRLFLNDIPSKMNKFLSPFPFSEHLESQFDHDNPISNDYFIVLELKVNINISFIDPL
jgi:hypothetical protein